MSGFTRDILFAWRQMIRHPGSSLLIVLLLALGIGVNSAMFSMTWHVLLAPLPYANGERLVKLEQQAPQLERFNFGWSAPTIEDFRNQHELFAGLSGYVQLPFTVAAPEGPRQVSAGVIGWNFFDVLGVKPLLGRSFSTTDDAHGAAPVLLLGHEFWRETFNADPGAVGRTLLIKDIAYTVVGVLPPIPPWPHANDIWIPAASDPYQLFAWTDGYEARSGTWTYLVLGRLQETLSLIEAQAGADTTARRLKTSYPDDYPEGYEVLVKPLQAEMRTHSASTFWILSALTLLVALVASANVASLNMANLAARRQELTVREAVGASPRRITRQLLAENLLLAGLGAVLALLIAYPTLRLLKDFAAGFTPLASEIGMDISVIGFASVITLLMWLLSTIGSLLGKRDINAALKESADNTTRSVTGTQRRQAMLILQFALAFLVLCSATLMLFSLYRLDSQPKGYEADRVLASSMMIDVDFGDPAQQQAPYDKVVPYYRAFSRTLLAETRSLPMVEDAGLLAGVPLLQDASYLGAVTFDIEGRTFVDPNGRSTAPYHAATEGYFEALGIPLKQGRVFDVSDNEASLPVALINESFAKRHFPQGDALGQRIRFVGDATWRTIVGVVGDLRSQRLDNAEGPKAYYNYWQYPSEVVTLYAKSPQSPEALGRLVSGIVRDIAPQQSIESIALMEALEAEWLSPLSLRTLLITLFGLLALVITLSGVIGVVSYDVNQRVRETGVHMAVGAWPARITAMFMLQGLKTYACGLVLGLTLALSTAPLLKPMLYDTSVFNPAVYATVIVLLTLAVLLAIYAPARKAGLRTPMEALHEQ